MGCMETLPGVELWFWRMERSSCLYKPHGLYKQLGRREPVLSANGQSCVQVHVPRYQSGSALCTGFSEDGSLGPSVSSLCSPSRDGIDSSLFWVQTDLETSLGHYKMAELMLLVGGPVPPWASHHFESLQLSGGGAFASLHEDKNLTSTHASVERRPSRQFSMLRVPYWCSPAATHESSGSGQRRWPAVILFALQIPVPCVAVWILEAPHTCMHTVCSIAHCVRLRLALWKMKWPGCASFCSVSPAIECWRHKSGNAHGGLAYCLWVLRVVLSMPVDTLQFLLLYLMSD